ncbi:hypothetical protein J0H58_13185 [bacterium]|nr:hypothetical protein [bacterium]
MTNDAPKAASPKFALGRQVATPGALAAIRAAGQTAHELLARHAAGDWGDLDDEDKGLNDAALTDGSRLFSAYRLRSGVKLWVITEAADEGGQRAATTILLPDEY